MSDRGWEHFAHVADVGIRGWGPGSADAFEQAALAMTAVITDLAIVRDETPVDVSCEAPDEELLLAEWLNTLVYEMATRSMLFSRFAVEITDHQLHGRAWGEPVDRVRHAPAIEVKGATYTELAVRDDPDRGRIAQCVLDV